MHPYEYRTRYLVIGLLLMMVCVQSLSVHFHLGMDQDTHAHVHSSSSMDADHFSAGHDNETCTDVVGTLSRQTLELIVFVLVFLSIMVVPASAPLVRPDGRDRRRRSCPPFFNPPLRAPPHPA